LFVCCDCFKNDAAASSLASLLPTIGTTSSSSADGDVNGGPSNSTTHHAAASTGSAVQSPPGTSSLASALLPTIGSTSSSSADGDVNGGPSNSASSVPQKPRHPSDISLSTCSNRHCKKRFKFVRDEFSCVLCDWASQKFPSISTPNVFCKSCCIDVAGFCFCGLCWEKKHLREAHIQENSSEKQREERDPDKDGSEKRWCRTCFLEKKQFLFDLKDLHGYSNDIEDCDICGEPNHDWCLTTSVGLSYCETCKTDKPVEVDEALKTAKAAREARIAEVNKDERERAEKKREEKQRKMEALQPQVTSTLQRAKDTGAYQKRSSNEHFIAHVGDYFVISEGGPVAGSGYVFKNHLYQAREIRHNGDKVEIDLGEYGPVESIRGAGHLGCRIMLVGDIKTDDKHQISNHMIGLDHFPDCEDDCTKCHEMKVPTAYYPDPADVGKKISSFTVSLLYIHAPPYLSPLFISHSNSLTLCSFTLHRILWHGVASEMRTL
jgi:hypothetical protein